MTRASAAPRDISLLVAGLVAGLAALVLAMPAAQAAPSRLVADLRPLHLRRLRTRVST